MLEYLHTMYYTLALYNSTCAMEYLSRVAAKIYFPLGENLTYDTGGFSSSEREKM